jgi:hypothetical protein
MILFKYIYYIKIIKILSIQKHNIILKNNMAYSKQYWQLTILIQLSLIHILYGYKCPPPKQITHQITFDKVVIQQPFPDPYNGIDVFNGVKTQNKGICSNTTIPRNCTLPTKKCNCIPFSRYLLFNLIPTNESQQLTPQDITTAVQQAKNITYVSSRKVSPIIPNILCSYNISQWSNTFSCLPKFCKNTTKVCLHSSANCTCIAQPCNLYVFIPI